jgi:hypothetical protein
MQNDKRDPLEVLKFELNFLEKGGYGRSPREPWRAQLIFEDSPTCMNYDRKVDPTPCRGCVLMQFVPRQFSKERVPCRHIPLNEGGETLDTLYRSGDQIEIEQEMKKWLLATIRQLELERADKKNDASVDRKAPETNVSHASSGPTNEGGVCHDCEVRKRGMFSGL